MRLKIKESMAVLCLLAATACGGGGGGAGTGQLLSFASVSPNSGFVGGGSVVTVSGSGFLAGGAPSVAFGGAPATGVMVLDNATLVCTVPAGMAGPVGVQVQNTLGAVAQPGAFTYLGFPPVFSNPDVRVETDVAGASRSQYPAICGDGSNVYVAWQDRRNGYEDVYFNRSSDGGATWLAQDLRLDTDTPGASQSLWVQVACDGPNVYVVWEDLRNDADGNFPDIYFNRSADGGATWLAQDVRLDTDADGPHESYRPRICSDAGHVNVVWQDGRSGGSNYDIHLNHSSDGGATWLAQDLRLDTDTAGSASSYSPEICGEGANVHVAWRDRRNAGMGSNGDIFYSRSTDGGATWLAQDVQLDTDGQGTADSEAVTIACSAGSVVAAWQDGRNGFDDIYMNRSADGGATWQAQDVRLDTDTPGESSSIEPQVCCEGPLVFVGWRDARPQGSGNGQVYCNASVDGGVTWFGNDVRVDHGPAQAGPARFCSSAGVVYAVWQDGRNGAKDVYFNVTTDQGATWQASDQRLDTDTAGAADSDSPVIRCDGARICVAWSDSRTPTQADIYLAHSP